MPDIDDVCMGHEYLKESGKYEHMWGIGRHVLGSQVYASGPIRGAASTSIGPTATASTRQRLELIAAEEALRSQWGERPPERFIGHCSV